MFFLAFAIQYPSDNVAAPPPRHTHPNTHHHPRHTAHTGPFAPPFLRRRGRVKRVPPRGRKTDGCFVHARGSAARLAGPLPAAKAGSKGAAPRLHLRPPNPTLPTTHAGWPPLGKYV